MSRSRRILARLLAGLAGAAILAGAGLYAASERILRRSHDLPLRPIALPSDPASLELGQRRATLTGCFAGCHGDTAEGQVWSDDWLTARFTAPNLTQVIHDYGDAELARLLRHGVRADGTTAFVMPAVQFRHLTDEDLGAILAFLKTLPPIEGPVYRRGLGPLGRLGLLRGQVYPSVDDVDPAVPLAGTPPPATPLERGRYIAMITCPECHGPDLEGWPGDVAPPLAIVAAYGRDEFHRLMREGLAKGGREVGLMTRVGRIRTVTLTDQEVDELYDYLRSRTELPAGLP